MATLLSRKPPIRARIRLWRSPMGLIALSMLASLVVLAIIGPIVWGPEAKDADPSAVFQEPSSEHWLGTDNLGRDLFARVLAATRFSIVLAVLATLLGATTGILLGSVTAVVGPRLRRWIGALINLMLAFPGLLVAIFFSVIFGGGSRSVVLALAIAYLPSFARITQTLASGVAGSDYVAAAEVLGIRRHKILVRHILPNIAEPLLLSVTTTAGTTLVGLSGLSFLGLGVTTPDYDWGLLLNQGLDRIYVTPGASLAPGIAILFASLAFQLFGEVWAGQARRGARTAPATDRPRKSQPQAMTSPDDDQPVLQVENLTVSIPTTLGMGTPVRDVTLTVRRGEIVGIVGESGSGKSLTALAIAGIPPESAQVSYNKLRFRGVDTGALSRRARQRFLATGMAVVFQNPASALNPSLCIGTQLTEVTRLHNGTPRAEAIKQAQQALTQVALPTDRRLLRSRPFQLSGGMRQRVMIAMGLIHQPKLIIADEPTTALDVTVQRQILDMLRGIRDDTNAAIVLISHDIAVVSQACDRVLVMYGGTIVEDLPADQLNRAATHPYTRALLESVLGMDVDRKQPLRTIEGSPPDPFVMSEGCRFAPRCGNRQTLCDETRPLLSNSGAAHELACWYPVEEQVNR
ncbi:MAG: dipeptide/oligopeptide/nickel ABC transporter permease/ATP-binding protein [Pseudonocardiales bacterium]|nr:dipeptide/oligopeptide/nickel ABC transporter permease/ATP-binding protein [Pseudonocardiales bacterium]